MDAEEKRKKIKAECSDALEYIRSVYANLATLEKDTGYSFPRRVMDEMNEDTLGSAAMIIRDHLGENTTSDKDIKRSLGIEIEEKEE